MPDILIQTLYIDIYGKGMEFGIRQIVDVINNVNTFNQGVQTYENVRGYIIKKIQLNQNFIFKLEQRCMLSLCQSTFYF